MSGGVTRRVNLATAPSLPGVGDEQTGEQIIDGTGRLENRIATDRDQSTEDDLMAILRG